MNISARVLNSPARILYYFCRDGSSPNSPHLFSGLSSRTCLSYRLRLGVSSSAARCPGGSGGGGG